MSKIFLGTSLIRVKIYGSSTQDESYPSTLEGCLSFAAKFANTCGST
jgi:hypothetical protein